MEKAFWEKRWEDQDTRWDVGSVSTPLKTYIDQLTDKSVRILIPGCGNGYEAEYLLEQGFENVFIIEISQRAITSFKRRCPFFPVDHIFNQDFFELTGTYDLILEQTFFCAIHPSMRAKYAQKMAEILCSGGKLVGVLFDFPLEQGPPFGGTESEYRAYFEPFFQVKVMESAHNSIKPRIGRELFVILERK